MVRPDDRTTWASNVSVREDRATTAELLPRYARAGQVRAVGVTDLLALRRAFYRIRGPPVEIPAEREARLEQGRDVHRVVGALLAGEGILEARVRRDGLVGRIDLLAEIPVEVKSSRSILPPDALLQDRSEHLEQLAMYCALVDRSRGRPVTLVAPSDTVEEVQVIDVAVRNPETILSEMKRRADSLRQALADGTPTALPRCPWRGRGCEYREAEACSCTGEEPAGASTILEAVERVEHRAGEEAALLNRLRHLPGLGATTERVRLREILYPRRAFYQRTRPLPAPAEPAAPSHTEPDTYSRLLETLESGPPGEVARLPPRTTELEDEVAGFRGRPFLVRTSRAWARYRPNELVARVPQYVLDLGLRCASTGHTSGVVVIGYERATDDRDRFQVLEVRFASLTPFSRLFRERWGAIREAISVGAAGQLPACPEWMTVECPYRSECGCAPPGSATPR